MAEAPLPRTRFEIGLELRNPSSNDVWVEKREARHSRSDLRIEVLLRSTPEGSEESIATIVRYGDPIDSAVPEVVLDFGSGRTSASIERDDLRKIHLGEPEIAKFGRLDGQDHEAGFVGSERKRDAGRWHHDGALDIMVALSNGVRQRR